MVPGPVFTTYSESLISNAVFEASVRTSAVPYGHPLPNTEAPTTRRPCGAASVSRGRLATRDAAPKVRMEERSILRIGVVLKQSGVLQEPGILRDLGEMWNEGRKL